MTDLFDRYSVIDVDTQQFESPPDTLIVLGFGQSFRGTYFSSCELAGHTPKVGGVHNEETEDHPDIFVCRGFKQTWPQFWRNFHHFG